MLQNSIRALCFVTALHALLSAQASAQYQIWIMSCDGQWGGAVGRWVKYQNTDTGGVYSNLATARAVAGRIQSNYRSQGYSRVHWDVGTTSSPPNSSPCGGGSGGGGGYQPTCRTYYAVNVYYRGYGAGSTGWAYTSYDTANAVRASYVRYGYTATIVSRVFCQ